MNDEKLKKDLGINIMTYRKRQGLTQAGLAEKLNYSDKAVSKWERGESIPDVLTLVQLAGVFGVQVDDLLADPNRLPEKNGAVVGKMEKAVEKTLKRKADKQSILGLSSLLVWFIALLIFVVVSSMGIEKSWIAFIYAIPANAIVLLSLRSAWHDFRWNKTLISVIVWGGLLSIYMSLLLFLNANIWKLFLLGVPGQLAVFLWFRLFRKQPKEEQDG
ncbi:MAG: helix-turn-helix transcriptional regulator [Oscillospiraceae bacterium]|nr:helix-turn-helix transcriptional regulator [Oscillospiraceae bacterium]